MSPQNNSKPGFLPSADWVIRMSAADARSLGPLRRRPGIQVCAQQDTVWLRSSNLDEQGERIVRALPGTRFCLLADGQLVAYGRHIPQGRLPHGPWQALSAWIKPQLESPRFAARVTERVRLRMVRGGEPAQPNVLVTSVERWQNYAADAPQVRLDRWTLACAADGRVIIRGTPLPPLRGTRFVESRRVATPSGWTWTPTVDASVLQSLFTLESGELALCHPDGSWDHLRATDFVQATRRLQI